MNSIHIHRVPVPERLPQESARLIHQTVEPVLNAFRMPFTHAVSPAWVSYTTVDENFSYGGKPFTINIPLEAREAFTTPPAPEYLGDPMPAVRSHAAAVEVALACRNAGLARNYCDAAHWTRADEAASDPVIQRALDDLGLPTIVDELPKPCPDDIGVSAAQRLLAALGEGYIVMLFGSRHRGDHEHHSDIDLMVQLTDDSMEHFDHALSVITDAFWDEIPLVDDDPPRYDLSIVEQWGDRVWEHPNQRLNPDGGTVTAFAHPETPVPDQSLLPVHLPSQASNPQLGVTGYLLTGTAYVVQPGTAQGRLDRLDQPGCKR